MKNNLCLLKGLSNRTKMTFCFFEYPSLVSEIFIFVERLMTSRIVSVQRYNSQNREYLGKYWCDAPQTCTQQCMSGKRQNDAHFDVAMVLLTASVPFFYEPNISILEWIRRGRCSYLKRKKRPCCPMSPY